MDYLHVLIEGLAEASPKDIEETLDKLAWLMSELEERMNRQSKEIYTSLPPLARERIQNFGDFFNVLTFQGGIHPISDQVLERKAKQIPARYGKFKGGRYLEVNSRGKRVLIFYHRKKGYDFTLAYHTRSQTFSSLIQGVAVAVKVREELDKEDIEAGCEIMETMGEAGLSKGNINFLADPISNMMRTFNNLIGTFGMAYEILKD